MRHFYESYQQRRLRNRIGNYNQHQHQYNHHHHHYYASSAYLYVPQPRTTLCYLVQNRDWRNVVQRCLSHPAEITFQDPMTGNTPLHLVCRIMTAPAQPATVLLPNANNNAHPTIPLEVIQAMGAASCVQNWDGATPLHIAASHRCSVHALKTLLEVSSSPTAAADVAKSGKQGDDDDGDDDENEKESSTTTSALSTLSRTGRAPIHYACSSFRGLELEAFKVLFEATLKDGNLRFLQQQQMMMINNEDYDNNGNDDFWIGEGDGEENEDESKDKDDNDDMIKEFRKEEEIMRMIMNDKEYLDHDGKNTKTHLTHQQQQQVVVVINVLGLKDATGQTPLGLLFRRYRERVRHVINRIDRIHDAASAAVQRDTLRRHRRHGGGHGNNNNISTSSTTNEPSRERLRRASLIASLTVQGELGELWSKARWIVARLTQERLEREQDWKYYPGPKTTTTTTTTTTTIMSTTDTTSSTLETKTAAAAAGARSTSPQAIAAAQEAANWAAEQCQSSFSHNNPLQDEHSDFFVPVPQAQAQKFHEQQQPHSPTMINIASDQNKKMQQQHQQSEAAAAAAAAAVVTRKFRIVHASVGLTGYGCPPEMIRLAISVHPHQVYEMDEDGNLPIHIAAMASSHLASAEEANNNHSNSTNTFSDYLTAASSLADNGVAGGGDDHSVLSDAMNSFFSSATISQTSNPFDKVIKILLQHYPQAAKIPQGKFPGKLPLILAMEQQDHQSQQQSGMVMIRGIGGGGKHCRSWEDGIRTLMYAHPPALHSSNRKNDITQALYPNVLALVAEDYAMTTTSRLALTLPLSSSRQHQHQRLPQRSSSSMSKLLRREACARTTVFELLRTKPEWLNGNTADEEEDNSATRISQDEENAHSSSQHSCFSARKKEISQHTC